MMRIAAGTALAALLAWAVVTPLASSAQTAADGASPKLHAYFEYEYAREATAMSLSKPHRQAVVAITEAFANNQLSAKDASARINSVLTADERDAVLGIEQSFWVAMEGIYANAYDGKPAKASLGVDGAPINAGEFLLVLIYGLGSATASTVP
jgi:hypothetical protein